MSDVRVYATIYKWCANKDEKKIYSQHKANKYRKENDPNEDIKWENGKSQPPK